MITRSAVFVSLMMLLAGAVQGVERGLPAKAEVTQVDRDQKVLSLTVDDAIVEVGDLFVVLQEPGDADTSEKNLRSSASKVSKKVGRWGRCCLARCPLLELYRNAFTVFRRCSLTEPAIPGR